MTSRSLRGAACLLLLAGATSCGPSEPPAPPRAPDAPTAAPTADLEPAVREKLAVAEERTRTEDDAAAWLHYARVLHAHRMTSEAVRAYDTARARGAADPFEPLYLAALCVKSRDPEEARRRLEEAATLRGGVAALHAHLAEIDLALGELDAAERHFRRLEDLLPGGPARLGLARVALARGEPARARVHLDAIQTDRPPGRGTLEARARVEQALGHPDVARDAARAARTAPLEPPVPDPLLAAVLGEGVSFMNHMSFALTFERRGELERALGRVDAALHMRPENPDALLLRAGLLRRLQRDDDAVVAYRAALEAGAAEAETREGLGGALAATGATEEAAQELERALAVEPGRRQARLLLARVLARSRPGDALEHAAHVLRAAPGDRPAQLLLAELLMGAGRFEAGTAYLATVNADGATDADARAALDRALSE